MAPKDYGNEDMALVEISERLGRIEERGGFRDLQMAEIKVGQTAMAARIEVLAGEVRDAKTALHVGAWMAAKVASLGGVVGAALVALASSLGWTLHK